jgi:hypothetical protein
MEVRMQLSNKDRLRKKSFVERLYASTSGMTREEAIEAAALNERQFFRDNDRYHIDNHDDLFRMSKRVLHNHLIEPFTYMMSEEFSDVLFARADMKLSARYLFSKLKPDDIQVIELPYKHRQTLQMQGLPCYTKTVLIQPVFRRENRIRILLHMPVCLDESDFPAYGTYENKLKNGIDEPAIFTLLSFVEIDTSESDIDISQSVQKFNSTDVSKEFLVKIFKSLMYIKSDGEIDLREERPLREVVTANPKKARRQVIELRQFPVIHVGWNFQKSPIYNKGEWSTSGHFRWQPYDSRDNPKYKLIWIDEHIKTRRQTSDIIESSDNQEKPLKT